MSTPTTALARGSTLYRIALLAPPLALAVLAVFHPRPSVVSEAIDQGSRFFWFHMVQLVLVGFLAVSVCLLTADMHSRAAQVSRWATGVFAVFFSAYDSAAGVATGLVWQKAQDLTAAEQAAVFEVTKDLPGLSLIFVLSIIGTGGWLTAMIAGAIAVRQAGAATPPYALLILAGVFLMLGHPFPGGTLAFGCYFTAVVLLEYAPGVARRTPSMQAEEV